MGGGSIALGGGQRLPWGLESIGDLPSVFAIWSCPTCPWLLSYMETTSTSTGPRIGVGVGIVVGRGGGDIVHGSWL